VIDLEQTRFGALCVADDCLITLRGGLLGFPDDTRFILIERERGPIAFLQSVDSPELAIPVLDGSKLTPPYPTHAPALLGRLAGAPADDLAVFVVVAVDAADRSLRANLVAPIVVDTATRKGSQIILPGAGYDARTHILIVDQESATVRDARPRAQRSESGSDRDLEEA